MKRQKESQNDWLRKPMQLLDEMVERRTKTVEQKIAQAESKAVAEVRAKAVDLAVDVAEKIIRQEMVGQRAEEFTASSINQVQKNLH